MTFCNNIPATKCFLRKEFVSDSPDIPDFLNCILFGIHTVKNQAMTFVAMIENGACYTKLPLHAFCWKKDAPKRNLSDLIVYDNFSYSNSVICYDYLKHMSCEFFNEEKEKFGAKYMFTIEPYGSDRAEDPKFYKPFHFLKMDEGNYAAQPTNRIIWDDYIVSDKIRFIPKPNVEIYCVE
jgi:hypothetical protein